MRSVNTTDRRVDLFFEVRDRPTVVREVVYKNAPFELKELESATGLRPGRRLDVGDNRNACVELTNFMKQQGYYFANATLEEGDKEVHERVVFNVVAGPQVRMRDIAFVGHGDWTSAEKLAEAIATKQPFSAHGATCFVRMPLMPTPKHWSACSTITGSWTPSRLRALLASRLPAG